ncbi:cobalt ABC transporter permease [Thalassospira tepidiphila]|uniref:cobalt ABC transporter permease n=1 Tax=Thalassospira tepidiphila TaxID=393657 RepID=UPI003AA89B1D
MARSLMLVFALGMLVFGAKPAQAHKVIASLFPSGSNIEGEIGFSNGVMAENTLVEIFDLDGNKIDEVTTDGDGFFVYTPSQQIDLRFRADLGAGHVAEATFAIADLAGVDGTLQAALSKAPTASGAGSNAGPAITRAQEEIIATIVRDELRPLRRELTAYKEKNDLQSILGGIGYIFGAFGIIYYIAARRLRAKAPNA